MKQEALMKEEHEEPPGMTFGASGMTLGRWEWVGLPEFGIACIQARLDVNRRSSSLYAQDVVPADTDGEPHLQFQVHPLPGDPSFVLVEARHAETPEADGSRLVVHTRLVVGEASFPVDLELHERAPRDFSLTLGRDALEGYSVDPTREALAGPPDLGWHPRTRRRPPE